MNANRLRVTWTPQRAHAACHAMELLGQPGRRSITVDSLRIYAGVGESTARAALLTLYMTGVLACVHGVSGMPAMYSMRIKKKTPI